jgi:lysozyme
VNDKLRSLIARHEGCRLDAYLDTTGHWTIGYGHLLEAPVPAHCTQDQADECLDIDIARADSRCALFLPGWDGYDEVRQAVFVDMVFNMGIRGLLGFKKFLTATGLGRWEEAAGHMLDSLWARQVKSRAVEDCEMMRTGEWPETKGVNV